jgi:peptidoglycan/LPS O-acetylase OafA/YrhL
LLAKVGSRGAFTRSRTLRLLLPLLAGTILFVAPQPWAELQEKAGYAHGFWHFWTTDYFTFAARDGVILPTYNHLWFVAYLWLYTLLLALAALAPAGVRARAQLLFDRTFAGWRLLALPIALLALARIFLFPAFGETHAIVDDPYAHLVYGFAFFFGVGLARSQSAWTAMAASWKPAAALALGGYLLVAAVAVAYPGEAEPSEAALLVARLGRSVQAWGAVIALMALARLHLHRDGPARRYLTEAIFPYYIAHQTIIILAGHWLKPLGLGAAAEFAIILPVTILGCAATYELARRVAILRPLLGLAPKRRAAAYAARAARSASAA